MRALYQNKYIYLFYRRPIHSVSYSPLKFGEDKKQMEQMGVHFFQWYTTAKIKSILLQKARRSYNLPFTIEKTFALIRQ